MLEGMGTMLHVNKEGGNYIAICSRQEAETMSYNYSAVSMLVKWHTKSYAVKRPTKHPCCFFLGEL